MKPAKQGIYDNTATMCREVWHEDPVEGVRLVQFATADLIAQKDSFLRQAPPFGKYPDIKDSQ
jgi:hypothetical protein